MHIKMHYICFEKEWYELMNVVHILTKFDHSTQVSTSQVAP